MQSPSGFIVDAGQDRSADPRWIGPDVDHVKVSGADTGGALSLFEYSGQAQGGPPLHLHHDQDENFIVRTGEYVFQCGGVRSVLRPGDTIFLPRGVPHAFRQTSATGPCRSCLPPQAIWRHSLRYLRASKGCRPRRKDPPCSPRTECRSLGRRLWRIDTRQSAGFHHDMAPVFLFRRPHPALAGFVRCHQIIRLRFAASEVVPAKPYWARPAMALAFYPRAREYVRGVREPLGIIKPRAVLIGQPTQMTMRQGGHDFSVYQIELQPGALGRLTGIPADDLVDRHIDAESVFPVSFRRVVNAIEDTDDLEKMIHLAET